MRIQGGIPVGGNLGVIGGLMAGLDLPFGGGQQYKQIQKENQPGAPRQTPGISPTRVFPLNAPGREGAIDVRFRQALGGYPGAPGNLMGMQLPFGFQNKYVS